MTRPLLKLVLEQGARVPLVGEVTVGRDPSCTVVLADPAVSRRHARISGSSVQDLGSLSGTFLDGVRITGPAPLHDGARLRLGDTELVVAQPRSAMESLQTIVVAAGMASPSGSRVRVRVPATRSSGWRPPKATVGGCSKILRPARSCGSATTTHGCSSSSTARTRRPSSSTAPSSASAPPARSGSPGCWPISASAA